LLHVNRLFKSRSPVTSLDDCTLVSMTESSTQPVDPPVYIIPLASIGASARHASSLPQRSSSGTSVGATTNLWAVQPFWRLLVSHRGGAQPTCTNAHVCYVLLVHAGGTLRKCPTTPRQNRAAQRGRCASDLPLQPPNRTSSAHSMSQKASLGVSARAVVRQPVLGFLQRLPALLKQVLAGRGSMPNVGGSNECDSFELSLFTKSLCIRFYFVDEGADALVATGYG